MAYAQRVSSLVAVLFLILILHCKKSAKNLHVLRKQNGRRRENTEFYCLGECDSLPQHMEISHVEDGGAKNKLCSIVCETKKI